MKVALFKDFKYDTTIVLQHYENANRDNCGDYVRISEIVDVEFPPREPSEIIAAEVNALNDVLNELMNQVHAIQTKKSELLALTHD